MAIEYTIAPADYGAYATYAIANEPAYRRILLRLRATIAVLWLFSAVTVSAVTRSLIPSIPLLLIGIVLVWRERHAYRDRLQRAFASAAQLCIDHSHSLEASPEGLHARCTVCDSTLSWIAVRGVSETPRHVFVHLGHSGGAYIVARERVLNGDLSALVADIRTFVDGRGA